MIYHLLRIKQGEGIVTVRYRSDKLCLYRPAGSHDFCNAATAPRFAAVSLPNNSSSQLADAPTLYALP